jgi:hypothetical protein
MADLSSEAGDGKDTMKAADTGKTIRERGLIPPAANISRRRPPAAIP